MHKLEGEGGRCGARTWEAQFWASFARPARTEHTASCTSDHHHYQQQPPPATTAIPAHTSLSLFSLVIPLLPNLFPSSFPSPPPIPPHFKPPYLPLLSFFNLWVTGLAVPFLVRRSISVGAPCLVRPTWFPPSKKSTPPSRDLPSQLVRPSSVAVNRHKLSPHHPCCYSRWSLQWITTWRSIRRGRPNLTISPRPPTRAPYPPSTDGSKT